MRLSHTPPQKGPSGLLGGGFFLSGRSILPALLLCLLFTLAACARRGVYVRPDLSNPVFTVAVLPFYNASNDVEGPRLIREEFFKRIQNRQYSVMPLEQSDALLMDKMGITLGSQLEMTTPEALGKVLGVDAVVYGFVLNFDDITTGVYNMKKVRAGFKLVDVRSGMVLWSRGLGVKAAVIGGAAGAGVTILQELGDNGIDEFSTINGIEGISGLSDWHIIRVIGTEKIGEAALFALSEKLLTTALGVHLMAETSIMLNRVMPGFPAGPGRSTPR